MYESARWTIFTCFCNCYGCVSGKRHCHSVTCGS